MREVASQRSHEQLAADSRVVLDAAHDVRAAEALRVLEGRIRDELARFEIEQAEHNGRRSDIHRDAVDRGDGAGDLDAVEEDAIDTLARDAWVQRDRLATGWQPQCVPLDAHLAATHRVTGHGAGICDHFGLARESEITPEVTLLIRGCREKLHSSGDFDDALFALAVLAARRRHAHA